MRIITIIVLSTLFWQASCISLRKDLPYKSRITVKQELYKGFESTERTDPKQENTYIPEVTVYFDFNQYQVTSESQVKLSAFYQSMMAYDSNMQYFVEGNTDTSGTQEYNLVLSEKRANHVIQYLISLGAKPEQFNLLARGELNPIADDEINPELNRRVIIYRKTKN